MSMLFRCATGQGRTGILRTNVFDGEIHSDIARLLKM